MVTSIPGKVAGQGGEPRQPPAMAGPPHFFLDTVACFLQWSTNAPLPPLDWHDGRCGLVLTER